MQNILLVEDNITLNNTISEMLELKGYEVHNAYNGMEGLDLAKKNQVDLIICDVSMPKMNGFETVEEFRSEKSNIFTPVLFLTALSSKANRRRAMQLGADDFLAKPFEYSELFITVERLLEKYSLLKNQIVTKSSTAKATNSSAKDSKALSQLQDYEDSLRRAKIIQEKILPKKSELKTLFTDFGLLYKPRDIISGDFYWIKKMGDKKLLAVGDCTGHGVPAALLTMVCANMLSMATDYFNLQKPSDILKKVNELVIENMPAGKMNLNDGMDIALCSIDSVENEIIFSGAKRPLLLKRKRLISGSNKKIKLLSKSASHHLYRIKGDLGYIGLRDRPVNFTDHFFRYNHGDQIYLFSDGYCDQFGGVKHKRLKSSKLIHTLVQIQDEKVIDQIEILEKLFYRWKGNQDQTDDICFFTMKL